MSHSLAGASEAEVRGRTWLAAVEALANFSHDSTGSARYNLRRARDRAFGAAMDVLRDVPVEERPDGLVADVDEHTALITEEGRDTAEATMRERVDECLAVLHETMEELEHNDRVTLTYLPREEEDAERRTLTGTVCKSNRGGVRILPDSGRHLYVLKAGWRVSRTHVDGGAARLTRPVGAHGTVTKEDGRGHVAYTDGVGWTHEAPLAGT